MNSRRIALIVMLVLCIGLLGLSTFLPGEPSRTNEGLPLLIRIPPFTLETLSGETVGLDDLLGSVWVMQVISPEHVDTFIEVSHRLAGMSEAGTLRPDVLVVAVLLDPPQEGAGLPGPFAQAVGADPDRRWVLTGPEPELRRLTEKVAGDRTRDPCTRLTLIDRRGIVRGTYDGLDPDQMSRLERDAARLHTE